jgi:chaperonin GroEL
MKIIKRQQEARDSLLKGVKLVYDCVCTTLSPKGRNVSISRAWGLPLVVHDGVTVAREVMAEDEFENQAVQLVVEAARKTNEEAGDGTTTSILLAYHIIDKGMEILKDPQENPMVLRKQIEATLPTLKEAIKGITKTTDKKEDIERVATISSTDPIVGKAVAEAVEKTGSDGLVTVEESITGETYVSYTEGVQISSGYDRIWRFVTNPDRMEAVVEDAAIIILGKKVSLQIEIVPLLEAVLKQNKNVVIFGDVQGDAMATIVTNKAKGNIQALVIDPPGSGPNRTNLLNDLAVYTGATLISDELGLDLEQFANQFDKTWVGHANKVIATKDTTIIVEGGGTKEAVDSRIEQIKTQIEQEKTLYEKEVLQERLARLTTGVAVVKVGAKTDIEMRERIERVKDAVGSARAALQEGVVPGGGVAFLRLAAALDHETKGSKLMDEVLHESIKKILINSGETEEKAGRIINDIDSKGGNWGYEVNSGEIKDMVEAGVIDPAKVIRLALENAISVAGSILTTDVQIVDRIEPDQQFNG